MTSGQATDGEVPGAGHSPGRILAFWISEMGQKFEKTNCWFSINVSQCFDTVLIYNIL